MPALKKTYEKLYKYLSHFFQVIKLNLCCAQSQFFFGQLFIGNQLVDHFLASSFGIA